MSSLTFSSEQSDSIPTQDPQETSPVLLDKMPSPKNASLKSQIGHGIRIAGEVSGKEDILINGRVEGAIAFKNNQLIIGELGYIEANVLAKVIIVQGEVKGDICASEQVVITKTGRVFGNINATHIDMEDGAFFKGNVDTAIKEEEFFEPLVENTKETPFRNLFKKIKRKENNLDKNISPEEVLSHLAFNSADTFEKTVIGESVSIKGEINAEEDVKMEGIFEGMIFLKNNTLEVGSSAHILANIFVKMLTSAGEIIGDIFATDQVLIKKKGNVTGNIFSPRFSIERGAVLKGAIEMDSEQVEKIFTDRIKFVTSRDKNTKNQVTIEKVKKVKNDFAEDAS